LAVESRIRRISLALARLEKGVKTAQIAAQRRISPPWYGFKANMARERFPAKWTPVRVKKTRQITNLEPIPIRSERKRLQRRSFVLQPQRRGS
jgi:hypothetical protein